MKKHTFWQKTKKVMWRCSGSFLMLAAAFFASAPCTGHLHEPVVPEKLRK